MLPVQWISIGIALELATALFCALLAGRGLDGFDAVPGSVVAARILCGFLVVAGVQRRSFSHCSINRDRPRLVLDDNRGRVRHTVSPWPDEPAVDQIAKRAENTPEGTAVYDALIGLFSHPRGSGYE